MWGRRAEALEEAQQLGMASVVFRDAERAVDGADVVVLCVPVGAMEGLVRQVVPVLGRETLVTDVGSVKGEVVSALEPVLQGRALFVGSHPMAGSERAGLGAARENLFEGAVCILTPETGRTPEQALLRARGLWEGVGCRVRELDPRVHDQVCSRISHVPHVVAAALVNAVGEHLPAAFDFCGPGFRDTTRVAGGLPEMWSEILRSNGPAVAEGLRQVVAQMESVIQVLEKTDPAAEAQLHQFLAQAKRQRDHLRCP
jgi:prephenate dehydrogenase